MDTVIQEFNLEVINVNDPPVITGFSALKTSKSTPVQIKFEDLNVEDVDNEYPDDFIMFISDGENYTHNDNIIDPVMDFMGTLVIPIYVNDGQDNSNTVYMNIEVGTNSIDNYLSENIKIYPNPFTDNLSIEFNGSLNPRDNSLEINLFDNKGVLIRVWHEFFQENEKLELNGLNYITPGNYTLIIKNSFILYRYHIVKLK